MLDRWRGGDDEARDAVFEILQPHLLSVARSQLARQDTITLQPADLVNESILRMLGSDAGYVDRIHLMATAALKVRAVLVDHIRARMANKRGGDLQRVTLTGALDKASSPTKQFEVFALHQALDALAEVDLRASQVIELTYFGGMKRQEISDFLGVSVPTVDRDLLFARSWLNRHMGP